MWFPSDFPADLRRPVEAIRATADADYHESSRTQKELIALVVVPVMLEFARQLRSDLTRRPRESWHLAFDINKFRAALLQDLCPSGSRRVWWRIDRTAKKNLERTVGWLFHLRDVARILGNGVPSGDLSVPEVLDQGVRPIRGKGQKAPEVRNDVERFKDSVLAKTGWKPKDIDFVVAAGYKKNSRNLFSRFVQGKGSSTTRKNFENLLGLSPAEFQKRASLRRK
jgi:hypothetical protein